MTDINKQFNDLDNFVLKMKKKYQSKINEHKNDELSIIDVKEHLIEEIFELFGFDLTDELIIEFKEHLLNGKINQKELIDVANMCWILDYTIRMKEE